MKEDELDELKSKIKWAREELEELEAEYDSLLNEIKNENI